MNDDDLKDRMKAWKIQDPPDYLSSRIAAHAVRHQQVIPLAVSIARALDAAFSDWSYGLAYKLASVVLISGIGLTLGLSSPPVNAAEDIDIVQLALGSEEGGGL
jgi:hypothetical protein